MKIFFTFTDYTISIESLFTYAAVRTISIGTICVYITWTGIRKTLVDICCKRNEELVNIKVIKCRSRWGVTNMSEVDYVERKVIKLAQRDAKYLKCVV